MKRRAAQRKNSLRVEGQRPEEEEERKLSIMARSESGIVTEIRGIK
nr:MAG TPA: hypothetical protein [Inoviridae sp.]